MPKPTRWFSGWRGVASRVSFGAALDEWLLGEKARLKPSAHAATGNDDCGGEYVPFGVIYVLGRPNG